jgi:hypothetical protein
VRHCERDSKIATTRRGTVSCWPGQQRQLSAPLSWSGIGVPPGLSGRSSSGFFGAPRGVTDLRNLGTRIKGVLFDPH